MSPQEQGVPIAQAQTKPYKRPKILSGETIKVDVGCGHLYVTCNRENDKIVEMLATLGHSGQCARGMSEAVTRCISVGLQGGILPAIFIKQLKGIRCGEVVVGREHIQSCADAIAKILEGEIKSDTKS